ncbi:MAG: hypothetical protein U5K30_17800 [Acidimicrobiales bacterium]|nr:hypothetical protein [Acidimicrobiales bacterium]
MRRLLFIPIAFALLAATTTIAGAANPAGTPTSSMTLDPTSGPPGTEFTVSNVEEDVCVTKGPTEVDLTAPGAEPEAQTVPADLDGNWEATFTVPEDTEVDEITVNAECHFAGELQPTGVQGVRAIPQQTPPAIVVYDPVTFTVTQPDTTTTTTTTEPTTTTTEPDTLDESDVAEGVVAQPTLTG